MHRILTAMALFVNVISAAPTEAVSPPQYLLSWGGLGTGPGQFNIPMGVAVDASGLVYVADHLNDRIQVFDANGTSGHCPGSDVEHGQALVRRDSREAALT